MTQHTTQEADNQGFSDTALSYADYYSARDSFGGASERYEWTIKTFLPNLKAKRVLEIGCGGGGS